MSQRMSGYARIPDEQYQTVPWPVHALLCHLPKPQCAWDPCDRGDGLLIATLLRYKINAVGTAHDFLSINEHPVDVDTLITSPPYGERRRGELAVAFIEHALTLKVPRIAMLLRSDLQLFPAAHALLARKRDHGRSEAALISLTPIPSFPARESAVGGAPLRQDKEAVTLQTDSQN